MAAIKVTYTLDDETVGLIEDAAERLSKPKSQIVREAVADYHSRLDRLSETERQRMLKIFDTMVPRIPERQQAEIDAEVREIRQARRTGGRLSLSEKRK